MFIYKARIFGTFEALETKRMYAADLGFATGADAPLVEAQAEIRTGTYNMAEGEILAVAAPMQNQRIADGRFGG